MFKKLILLSALLSISQFSNAEIKATTIDQQPNVEVALAIADHCEFSGWIRLEKEIQVHVNCNGINSFSTYIDDGLFTNFVVVKGYQKEPVSIRIYKKALMNATGLDWNTISKSLDKNREKNGE
jgi:hypothetical protein